MLIKTKTLSRLSGNHKRDIGPDIPIRPDFRTRKQIKSSAKLITPRVNL